jgi:hypothetical protein
LVGKRQTVLEVCFFSKRAHLCDQRHFRHTLVYAGRYTFYRGIIRSTISMATLFHCYILSICIHIDLTQWWAKLQL